MKRKVIKQGHNTLTVTLPNKWAKNFNLKAGDEIDVYERDNGLFITTEKRSEHLKTEIDLTNLDLPTIWKYVMSVYREGYDELKLKFDPNEKLDSPYKYFISYKLDEKYGKEENKKTPLEFFHEMMNRFIGLEIVDYGKDFVLIKEMTEPNSKEFDNALRRIFLLLEQMAEEICETMDKGDVSTLRHIHDIDINLDKFHDYCIRILNKVGNKDSKKTSLLTASLFLLECLGDEFKNISHHLLYDFSKSNYKTIEPVTQSIKKQLELYYHTFYKFDKEKIIESSNLDKERYFNFNKQYKQIKKEEEREIFHHLRVIAKYLNTLTEIRIQMEF